MLAVVLFPYMLQNDDNPPSLALWLADYQLHSLYIYHFRSRMLMQIYVLLNKKTNVAKWVFYRDVNR